MAALLDAPRVHEMPEEDEQTMLHEQDGVRVTRRGNYATVDFNPGASRMSRDDSDTHSANLVDELSSSEENSMADQIIEWVDTDLQSRKDWDQRMDQAMELLGLKNVPGDELAFDGASSITYPLIGEAVVQFQSRAIDEVFPSEGPVKVKIVGEMTREKEEQAERIKNHMNYQIMDEDRSYFWHVDQMLFYLPLGGSAFKKTYYDDTNGMVVSRFIKSTDFIVPYIATDLASAPRYTHRMFKNSSEMKKLFATDFYKEIELLPTLAFSGQGDDTSRAMQDRADDRSPELHDKDYLWTLYECHCDLELDVDKTRREGVPLPYIVTVERESRKIVSVRRNWRERDPNFDKRMWFTHYRYLPGLGFYGLGLLHMIGSLAEGASGAVRSMLDSASFANMQGGYVSNDAKMKAGDHHIDPGVYKEVNMSSDELSRAFYTPPFKEPSPAMAKLFELLVHAGKSFASSTEVMTGEANNNAPVGTTIALIEQSSKPFSAIHRRLHMAAAEEFALRAELNYEFLPDEYPYQVENAEGVVYRDDYDGRVDVLPISDPNIFSSTQRIAQGQALIQLSAENPDIYHKIKVHERFLRALRIPDHEELLKQNQTKRQDPVSENVKLLTGEAVRAFVEQDHEAHIQVHMNFMNGLNEQALEVMGPMMQAHLAEHYAMKYFTEVNRQLGGQLPALGSFDEDGQEMPPEMDQMIAQAVAQLPQIEIMPPDEDSPDFEELAFQNEERRKDEEHAREQDRKDEQAIADIERKELEALAKDQREAQVAATKLAREERAAKAKEQREARAAAAKIANDKKLADLKVKTAKRTAAAKPKPSGKK